MSDHKSLMAQMERSRAEWSRDKGDDADAAPGRPVESLPTKEVALRCEVCGTPFGSRVYYDNANAKDTGFCSIEHVQLYREQKKAKQAAPKAAAPQPRPARKAPTPTA